MKNQKNETYVTLTLLCTKCKFEWDLLRKWKYIIQDKPPEIKNFNPLWLVFTQCPICNNIDYMPVKKTWKP